jgi:hypothetical protein
MAFHWFGWSFLRRGGSGLLVGLCLVACSSSQSDPCNVSTAPASAAADGTVSYHASITGDADITTVIYRSADGPQDVSTPTLPFQVDVAVASGQALAITASGTAKSDGNVLVGYTFQDSAGSDPVVASAQCR